MSNRFRLCIELSIVLTATASLIWRFQPDPVAADTPHAKASTSKLVGTWRRIGDLQEDGSVKPFEEKYAQIKHVTPTHFTWFVVDPKTHTAEIGYSGRCSAEGETYTEYIETIPGTVRPPEGATAPVQQTAAAQTLSFKPADVPPVKCKFRVEGDRWYHTLPSEFTSGKPETEVWVRMKPGEKLPDQ